MQLASIYKKMYQLSIMQLATVYKDLSSAVDIYKNLLFVDNATRLRIERFIICYL